MTGIPADSHRDVPDISMAASPDHDGYLYCTQIQTDGSGSSYVSSCQATSLRISDPGQQDDQGLTIAGGTSFAAPSFAGLLAVIEQKLATGGGLGNINPSLYKLAANATTYASAFHDITTGNNQVPCTTGSTDCPSGSNPVIGYAAATGYDLATGLGSLDGNNLATAYAALVVTTGTKTTLSVNPGTSIVINEQVTFTAVVAPNTLTVAPTGTVTFNIDGTATQVPLSSSPAPYAGVFQTTFPTAGKHTVSATYSGDSNYTSSTSATTTLSVAASGTEATTTAVVVSPTTIALGGALTLTATRYRKHGGNVDWADDLHHRRKDHRNREPGDARTGEYGHCDTQCFRNCLAGLHAGHRHHYGYLRWRHIQRYFLGHGRPYGDQSGHHRFRDQHHHFFTVARA